MLCKMWLFSNNVYSADEVGLGVLEATVAYATLICTFYYY